MSDLDEDEDEYDIEEGDAGFYGEFSGENEPHDEGNRLNCPHTRTIELNGDTLCDDCGMVFETASNLAEEHFAPEGQRNAVDKFGRRRTEEPLESALSKLTRSGVDKDALNMAKELMYEFYEAKYAYDAKKRMEAGDCGVRHPPQSHSGETHNRLCAVIAFYTMQAKDREVRLKQAADLLEYSTPEAFSKFRRGCALFKKHIQVAPRKEHSQRDSTAARWVAVVDKLLSARHAEREHILKAINNLYEHAVARQMTDGVVPSHVAAACTLVILDGLREHGRRLQSEKGTIVLPMDARQLIYKAVPTKKQLEKMLEADFKHPITTDMQQSVTRLAQSVISASNRKDDLLERKLPLNYKIYSCMKHLPLSSTRKHALPVVNVPTPNPDGPPSDPESKDNKLNFEFMIAKKKKRSRADRCYVQIVKVEEDVDDNESPAKWPKTNVESGRMPKSTEPARAIYNSEMEAAKWQQLVASAKSRLKQYAAQRPEIVGHFPFLSAYVTDQKIPSEPGPFPIEHAPWVSDIQTLLLAGVEPEHLRGERTVRAMLKQLDNNVGVTATHARWELNQDIRDMEYEAKSNTHVDRMLRALRKEGAAYDAQIKQENSHTHQAKMQKQRETKQTRAEMRAMQHEAIRAKAASLLAGEIPTIEGEISKQLSSQEEMAILNELGSLAAAIKPRFVNPIEAVNAVDKGGNEGKANQNAPAEEEEEEYEDDEEVDEAVDYGNPDQAAFYARRRAVPMDEDEEEEYDYEDED